VVVAFDFGTCAGRSAYRKITWYFPSRGESVDTREYQNICTGRYAPYQPSLSRCGAVTLIFPHGHAAPPTLFDCARGAVQILYEVSG
jgi:hypothetical protein